MLYCTKPKPSLLDDLSKERIKFNVKIIKLLTLVFITTAGGTLALVLNGLDSLLEMAFGLGEMVFAFTSGTLGIIFYKSTLKKLK
jgi:hypothetical protein